MNGRLVRINSRRLDSVVIAVEMYATPLGNVPEGNISHNSRKKRGALGTHGPLNDCQSFPELESRRAGYISRIKLKWHGAPKLKSHFFWDLCASVVKATGDGSCYLSHRQSNT